MMIINGVIAFSTTDVKHLQSKQVSISKIIQLGGIEKRPFSGQINLYDVEAPLNKI